MAPEVLKRERYDKSADIYSLSITIWEILYRRYQNIKTPISFRIPFDHVMSKSVFELQVKISNGMRPELGNDLSEAVLTFLPRFSNIFPDKLFKFRCWHTDASKRPAIDDIHDFSVSTLFFSASPENSVNEPIIPFENLNGLFLFYNFI